MRLKLAILTAVAITQFGSAVVAQQTARRNVLSVRFEPAPLVAFPSPADCNSPSVWIGDDFYVYNSLGGTPKRAKGSRVEDVADDADETGESFHYNQDIGS